jgi:hypothetical protein
MLWEAAPLSSLSLHVYFLCPAPAIIQPERYCVCLAIKLLRIETALRNPLTQLKHHCVRDSLSPPLPVSIRELVRPDRTRRLLALPSLRSLPTLRPSYQSEPRYPNTLGPRNQDIVGLSASHRPFTSLFRDLETKCRCRRVVLILALPLP